MDVRGCVDFALDGNMRPLLFFKKAEQALKESPQHAAQKTQPPRCMRTQQGVAACVPRIALRFVCLLEKAATYADGDALSCRTLLDPEPRSEAV